MREPALLYYIITLCVKNITHTTTALGLVSVIAINHLRPLLALFNVPKVELRIGIATGGWVDVNGGRGGGGLKKNNKKILKKKTPVDMHDIFRAISKWLPLYVTFWYFMPFESKLAYCFTATSSPFNLLPHFYHFWLWFPFGPSKNWISRLILNKYRCLFRTVGTPTYVKADHSLIG